MLNLFRKSIRLHTSFIFNLKIMALIICLIVAAIIVMVPIIMIYKKGFNDAEKRKYENQADQFYEEPILFIIDGKRMNFEESEIYYNKELQRSRRKNTLHLMIYDTDLQKYIFDDSAYKYYENLIKP